MDSKECPTCQRRRGKKYTAEEVVLLAIARLEERHGIPEFDVDTIAVEAWKFIDPVTFGMRNYPYPNNKQASATLTQLCGGRRGRSRKVAEPAVELAYTRHYRLTDKGRARVRPIMDQARAAGSSDSLSG